MQNARRRQVTARHNPSLVESLETRRMLATLTTLATFPFSNGSFPSSGLVLSGNTLYGTTSDGGAINAGTVFSVPVGGGTLTTLATFNNTNGRNPLDLILSGNTLYGTTQQGGSNSRGTIFSLPITGGEPSTLAAFNGTNGAIPVAGVTLTGNTLYGTTFSGGAFDLGTVYSLPSTGGEPTTLATFNVDNGSGPAAAVIADTDGKLYSTTAKGGANQHGTVFKLDLRMPPIVVSDTFLFETAPLRVVYRFDSDVSASLSASDITVRRIADNAPVAVTQVIWNAALKEAMFSLVGAPLPDGDYRVTLNATGVTNAAGTTLAADRVTNFFALGGDANRDRSVNFNDLVNLVRNYNTTTRTFSDGDFNSDGNVNFSDLVILARNYNTSLPTARTAATPASPRGFFAKSDQSLADDLLA